MRDIFEQIKLNKYKKTVNEILELRDQMMKLSDEELKSKTNEFKEKLQNGSTPEDLLIEAFAVVREASRRVTGMEPFPVQLIGGMILHEGNIAEMKTGEGKSLVCAMPSYLNALSGKGVHVVTVNDYLAKRDAEEIGCIHRFLGLTVGCVLQPMDTPERKEQYQCDITYVTNNELGFDYLRDNMVQTKDDIVLRGLPFCIIDEADSILIDEARTPLIISNRADQSTDIYTACDVLAKSMKRGEASAELTKMSALINEEITETGDYIVNEKDKNVVLTEAGIHKAEEFFGIQNLSDSKNIELQHCIDLALRANALMHKDKDYVVKDDQIMIVDDFTGRIMDGRRYSDGLHQAIEAKEGVAIKKNSLTLATITFQNFFNKYQKKAGMTGTAYTEKKELSDIYHLDVIRVPTNKPVIRVDREDIVYKTKEEKYDAVINEIKETHQRGQPVLVGTVTIDVSEHISNMLQKEHIKHQVLNAKFHELEAEIIAKAGEYGSVTIATNMAGRGTDIKLDERAKKAGGLKVIGTERHESRRIDNQLRGRSGRQGDPGESVFYVSLEDDLLRLFGSEKLIHTFENLGIEKGEPLKHRLISSAIEKAQKAVEDNNYGIRKNLLDYDAVNNEHRELVYAQRMKALEIEDVDQVIRSYIKDVVNDLVNEFYDPNDKTNFLINLGARIYKLIPYPNHFKRNLSDLEKDELISYLTDVAIEIYTKRKEKFEEAGFPFEDEEKKILLLAIDRNWMIHINNLEQLKESVHLFALAQKDPRIEYRIIAYDLFEKMCKQIKEDTIRIVYSINVG